MLNRPSARIEVVILAGVDDVEAGGPEGDGGGEPENSRIERAAHGDPGGGRRDAQAEAQHQVRERGEALGERIEEDDAEATGASLRHSGLSAHAATKKISDAAATKAQPKPRESRPAGRCRILVRGLRAVDFRIHQPVECHGGGARSDHRDHDP